MNNTTHINGSVTSGIELPQVLTDDEVAKLLQVDRKTVRTAFKSGAIPGGRRIGRNIRFHRDRVLKWLDEAVSSQDGAAISSSLRESREEAADDEQFTEIIRRTHAIESSETFAVIQDELACLNRVLRRDFGAREKVVFEPDYFYGYKHYVDWRKVGRKGREAIVDAARKAFNQNLDDVACCRGLSQVVAFLRGVNAQLTQGSGSKPHGSAGANRADTAFVDT